MRCKNAKRERVNCDLRLKIALVDGNGNEMISDSKDFDRLQLIETHHHGFQKFASRVWLEGHQQVLDSNNCLTFKAELTLFDNEKASNFTMSLDKTMVHLAPFKELYENAEMSDLTLVMRDKGELNVHKLILSMNSIAFKQLIAADMSVNQLEIPDFDFQVINQMLRFAYVGKTENIDDIVFDLYRACDKYRFEKLKGICYNKIVGSLNESNVFETWKWAEEMENAALSKKCMKLMKK